MRFVLFFCLLVSCTSPEIESFEEMKGTWNLVSTSGGFTGAGFDSNFDQLAIYNNYDFELFFDDAVVGNGTVMQIDSIGDEIHVIFSGTSTQPNIWTELIDDPEKMVTFEDSDKMNLFSPCCDRYNLHFEKE